MSENMVTNQPRPFIMSATSDKWTSGICDCFEDVSLCCFAFWCLPCFTCKTSHDAGECLCLPLLDSCGLFPPITIAMRAAVRQRYGIEGTICQDCVYTFFCYSCTWCQIARELKTRKDPITFVNMSSK